MIDREKRILWLIAIALVVGLLIYHHFCYDQLDLASQIMLHVYEFMAGFLIGALIAIEIIDRI